MDKRFLYTAFFLMSFVAALFILLETPDEQVPAVAVKQNETPETQASVPAEEKKPVAGADKSIQASKPPKPDQKSDRRQTESVKMTGLELAQLVYDREDGDSIHSVTEMILEDKNGNRRTRIMETYSKDFDPLVKAFIEFKAPADIEGTRFLSWENEEGDDTQYLYLPELGRARRIVSNQKKLRFVNTDFSYEDMERRKPDQDKHEIAGETSYLNRPVYLLKSVPNQGSSQYGLRKTLVDQESFIPVSVDFYDGKGNLVKEFRVHELEKVNGIWTAMKAEMRDLKAGHKTFMNLTEVEYNGNLSNNHFELRNLER